MKILSQEKLTKFASQYLELSEAQQDKMGITEALMKLANLNVKEGKVKEASEMIQKAMDVGYGLKAETEEKEQDLKRDLEVNFGIVTAHETWKEQKDRISKLFEKKKRRVGESSSDESSADDST